MFPVDLVLLSSSNEGNVAYIETASLDGEKNLKPRSAYP
jgi:phospholipid-transporting ATPase